MQANILFSFAALHHEDSFVCVEASKCTGGNKCKSRVAMSPEAATRPLEMGLKLHFISWQRAIAAHCCHSIGADLPSFPSFKAFDGSDVSCPGKHD